MNADVIEVTSSAFRRFWAAQTLSQIGQRFGSVAIPVVAITVLDAGSSEVGYLTAALTVCYLLVGLPAGAWVDRWNKRSTMMRAAWVRAIVLISIPALWLVDSLSLSWMYLIAVIVGIASVFFDVAYQSIVPFIVADDSIESANARLEASSQVSAAGGPAVAGFLFRFLSAPLVLLVDALAYVGCAWLLATVTDTEPRREASPSRRSIVAEVREGVGFVVRQPVLRRLVVSVGVSNFFATIIFTLAPLLMLRELDLGTTVMGIVLSVGTLGGIAGAALLPTVRGRWRAGVVMGGGLALAAVSTAAFPVAGSAGDGGSLPPILLLILGQFGMTLGAVMFNITQVSLRQRLCPKDLLGRMNASIRFVVWGSMPLAALVAGWLGSGIGVVPTMWVGVVGTCLTALPILGIDRLIEARDV